MSGSDGLAQFRDQRRDWSLAAILFVAFALRAAAAIAFPSLHHPDEAFQLFEPAHRMAFGWGVKTWEFVDGIRSLVPPAALAGVMRLAEPVLGGPEGYNLAVRLSLSLLSLLPIVFIWRMGLRESRTHALLGALVAATWFEIVYFAPRPLTEALASDFALTALALASRPRDDFAFRSLAGIGACLALTVLLRLQLAPGAALIALFVGRLQIRRRWAPMILGAAPALIVFGAADWIAWGAPFASYWRAVAVNLGAAKASVYGVKSWSWYFTVIASIWGPFALVAVALCAVRLRRSWLWIGFATVELAVHTLIPHKEYRFVFPALAALVVAAALGSADLLARFGPRLSAVRPAARTGAVAGLWLIVSATLATGPQFRSEWFFSGGALQSEALIAGRGNVCGVLFYDLAWTETGGYAFLHRRVPLYFPVYAMRWAGDHLEWPADLAPRRAASRQASGAYNYVVLKPASAGLFEPQYAPQGCFGVGDQRACVLRRPGACAPDPRLTAVLDVPRLGEPIVGR